MQKVHCDRGHIIDRDIFQDQLSDANPQWKAYADEMERTGDRPRTNPDGDVRLFLVGYYISTFSDYQSAGRAERCIV